MAEPFTVRALRELAAEVPPGAFWEGEVRQALKWAADVLEAAQAVIDERQQVSATATK